jgi:hypothetical protein
MITELLLITLIFTWAFATGIDQIDGGWGFGNSKTLKSKRITLYGLRRGG